MSTVKEIIGLAGPKGVGKSTYASQMVFEYYKSSNSCPVRLMSFATPLKEMLGCIVHKDYMEDKERVIPHLGVNARHCLQTLGTEWGRNINSEIWVNIARHRISEERPNSIIIIDDVRFDNEAHMIKELGGSVWELNRKGTGGGDKHTSEAGISRELISKFINLDEE